MEVEGIMVLKQLDCEIIQVQLTLTLRMLGVISHHFPFSTQHGAQLIPLTSLQLEVFCFLCHKLKCKSLTASSDPPLSPFMSDTPENAQNMLSPVGKTIRSI
jgi:hypothetical protein